MDASPGAVDDGTREACTNQVDRLAPRLVWVSRNGLSPDGSEDNRGGLDPRGQAIWWRSDEVGQAEMGTESGEFLIE